MPIYKKFENLLLENSLRVSEVAEATNISPSTFSDWKTGKSFPKVDKLQTLAKHFNVSIEYFLNE